MFGHLRYVCSCAYDMIVYYAMHTWCCRSNVCPVVSHHNLGMEEWSWCVYVYVCVRVINMLRVCVGKKYYESVYVNV